MQRKLTATLVAKLTVPDGKKSIKIFDTEVVGLGVRKMATGIASFIFEKRPKGAVAAKQITLGRCGDWTVDQARAKAKQLAIDFNSHNYLSSEVIKGATPAFYDAVKLYDALILSRKSKNYRDKTLGTLKRCQTGVGARLSWV